MLLLLSLFVPVEKFSLYSLYFRNVVFRSGRLPFWGYLACKCFLCSFLSLYNRDGVEPIGLDDAASRLGLIWFMVSVIFYVRGWLFGGWSFWGCRSWEASDLWHCQCSWKRWRKICCAFHFFLLSLVAEKIRRKKRAWNFECWVFHCLKPGRMNIQKYYTPFIRQFS